ncbi:hypothetical protein ACLOJK_024348 [Asimina triloba]
MSTCYWRARGERCRRAVSEGGVDTVEEVAVDTTDRGEASSTWAVVGTDGRCRLLHVVTLDSGLGRCRRRDERPGSFDPAACHCHRQSRWRGKMLGATAAVIDGWIKVIGLGHKNQAIVIVPSRFGDGGRLEEMRAELPATMEMGSSTCAIVVDVVLRLQRIGDLLDVSNVMDDLDYSMGCPLSVGLPERRTTSAVAVGAVETSP